MILCSTKLLIARFIDGLVFSNLWIAFIAAFSVWGLCLSQNIVDLQAQNYTFFVFFATLASYNFHYGLPLGAAQYGERAEWQRKNRIFISLGFIIGLIFSFYFFLRIYTLWGWLLGLILTTFFYSAPKINHFIFAPLRAKLACKTFYVAAHWWFITAFLPIWVWGFIDKTNFFWLLYRATLIFIIAALFDYRDKEIDGKNQLYIFFNSWSERYFKLFLQILNLFCCIFIILSYLCHEDIYSLCSRLMVICLLQLIFIPRLQQPNERLYLGLLDALWAIGF